MKPFIQVMGIIVGSIIIFHTTAILFGAPLVESSRETLIFAVVLTAVTVIPALSILKLNSQRWIKVFILFSAETRMERAVFTTSVCSVLGAWLGALPIPLDWDRPWQVWPISCVLGTLCGFGVGLLIAAVRHLYTELYKHKST